MKLKSNAFQSRGSRLKALIELILLKSTSICALTAAFGVVMTGVFDPLSITLIALIFGTLMGGFFSLDSVKDIEADKINKPNRPLPSGRLSKSQAKIFVITLFSLNVLLTLVLYVFKPSLQTVILSILSLTLAISYSLPPTLSRIPLLSNAVLASLFTIFPILAGWTLFNPFERAPFSIIGALFFVAWGDIEDLEDIEGDKLMGIKTIPIWMGARKAAFTFSFIVFISILIGVHDFLVHQKLYWVVSLPQQFAIALITLWLIRRTEKSDIYRIHHICEILAVSTGLTLLVGYTLLS